MPSMELWIEYASTCSNHTMTRIVRLAAQLGVTLDWQSCFLPLVREDQGLGFPLTEASAKAAHMWLGLERLANKLGVPYRRPSIHLVKALSAAHVARADEQDGWSRRFTEEAFRLHWTQGCPIGTDDDLRQALDTLGLDAAQVLQLANFPVPSAASAVCRPSSSATSCSEAAIVSRTQSTGR